MKLHRSERKYVYWPFKADEALATAEVYLEGSWREGTIVGVYPAEQSVRLLVAGPDATSNPTGTVVLSSGTHSPLVRFVDSPEILVSGGGTISVS